MKRFHDYPQPCDVEKFARTIAKYPSATMTEFRSDKNGTSFTYRIKLGRGDKQIAVVSYIPGESQARYHSSLID